MFEMNVLPFALSIDAFAFSIGLDSKGNEHGLGLEDCLFFGVFHALMPFIGYLSLASLLHQMIHDVADAP